MRCPNCKTELKQDDIYCYQCGTRINWFWRYKIHLIVVVAVIVFFAIGGTTVFTLYKNGVFDGKKEVAVVQKEEKDTVATGESSSENNPAQPPQEADAKATATPAQQGREISNFVPEDKTKEMKKKLEEIVTQSAPFLSLCVRWEELGGGHFAWDNQVATQAVLYDLLYGDPSSRTGKMHLQGYDNRYAGIAKSVKKEMKQRYDDAYTFDMSYGDTFPYYLFRKQNKKVEYGGEELQSEKCDASITKVTQIEKDTYEAVIKAGLVKTYNPSQGTWEKFKLTLRKNKKSKYGYSIMNVEKKEE